MSNSYHPDKWVVLKFTQDNETVQKVFASWYGGYTTGDRWKLSSAIDRVEETEDVLEFHCCSGSTYYCSKDSHGMSAYSASVYSYWLKEAKDVPISVSTDYSLGEQS